MSIRENIEPTITEIKNVLTRAFQNPVVIVNITIQIITPYLVNLFINAQLAVES